MTKPCLKKNKSNKTNLKTSNSYVFNNFVLKRQFSQLVVKVFPATPLATLILSACGNDTGQIENNDSAAVVAPVVTSLSGAVVKGPLSGALVYADADGDGIGDGDPITTASDGSYTVSTTNANATIIAMSGPDTIDTSSGEALSGITLKAPAGSTVVTPATTILEAQPEIEPAQLAIALGIPTIFSGAIITEQIFRVNGLGQLLIIAIEGADIPLVQTLTFLFAILIVLFNLIADVVYGILDPRIRYD